MWKKTFIALSLLSIAGYADPVAPPKTDKIGGMETGKQVQKAPPLDSHKPGNVDQEKDPPEDEDVLIMEEDSEDPDDPGAVHTGDSDE